MTIATRVAAIALIALAVSFTAIYAARIQVTHTEEAMKPLNVQAAVLSVWLVFGHQTGIYYIELQDKTRHEVPLKVYLDVMSCQKPGVFYFLVTERRVLWWSLPMHIVDLWKCEATP